MTSFYSAPTGTQCAFSLLHPDLQKYVHILQRHPCARELSRDILWILQVDKLSLMVDDNFFSFHYIRFLKKKKIVIEYGWFYNVKFINDLNDKSVFTKRKF